jgi:hypothetical protein
VPRRPVPALQPAFPLLALGGRLQTPTRPLRSALLAMHHPIGASTGYMDFRRGDWAGMIERACEVSTFAAELSALGEDELPGLVAFLQGSPRLPFHYLAVHAPTKRRKLPEAALVAGLAQLPSHVDAVVVHPDQIADPAAWAPLGRRLVIENMDPRKTLGQLPEDLAPVFAALPEAGFCLDVAHAGAVEEEMGVAHRLLDAFGARLRQVHVSSLRAGRSSHTSLYRKDEARYARVLARCPDVPWILEAPPPRR